jgi:hypothetical protein
MSEDRQGAPSAPSAPSAPEIYSALRALTGEPYGPPRSARTEELVEAADLGGLDEPLATALLALVDAYEFGLEPRKLPLAFARALKLYDAKPEVFDEREVHRLYWCSKWVTAALIAVPEVPLATIQAWIDQMRERYIAAGHGLNAVEAGRFALASHTGDDLDFRFECWSTRGRDEFSDCEACEARDRGRYRAERGDHARALEEWEPVLEGAVSCAVEPSATIAECLLALVRLGRLDEAASLHRSGYRLTRGQVSMAVEVGRHLEFAALTGNAPRGLELLAENRNRFDSVAEPLIELDFLTGVRVLMVRLVAEGAGDVPVPGPPGSGHTAVSLLAETTTRTEALAASFDARNKTNRVSDRLRSRCAQEPLTETPLPLGVRSAPIAAATATPPIPPTRKISTPQDFPALLAEAREASRIGRPDADTLWDLVVQQLGDREPDEELRAELAIRAGTAASRRGSWSEACDHYARARTLMEAAGKPGRAALAWSRILWVQTLEGDGASVLWDELDAMRAAADALLTQEQMTAENYCSALQSRVIAAALPIMKAARKDNEGTTPAESDMQRFETEAQAMREAAARLGATHYAARVDGIRADVLVAAGDTTAAAEALRSAVSVLDGCERPWLLPLPPNPPRRARRGRRRVRPPRRPDLELGGTRRPHDGCLRTGRRTGQSSPLGPGPRRSRPRTDGPRDGTRPRRGLPHAADLRRPTSGPAQRPGNTRRSTRIPTPFRRGQRRRPRGPELPPLAGNRLQRPVPRPSPCRGRPQQGSPGGHRALDRGLADRRRSRPRTTGRGHPHRRNPRGPLPRPHTRGPRPPRTSHHPLRSPRPHRADRDPPPPVRQPRAHERFRRQGLTGAAARVRWHVRSASMS